MSRDDLLTTNAEIVGKAATETLKYSPDAIYVILTNPLDTMAYMTLKVTGLPPHRVVGQAGVLDSARMRAFVAMETGISVENIQCYVMGGHGDEMVRSPAIPTSPEHPLRDYLPADRLAAIVERTAQAAAGNRQPAEDFGLYAPKGAAVAQMVEAILKDKSISSCRRRLALEGQHGLTDMYFGVPVVLGRKAWNASSNTTWTKKRNNNWRNRLRQCAKRTKHSSG